jgi:hypothetical protein
MGLIVWLDNWVFGIEPWTGEQRYVKWRNEIDLCIVILQNDLRGLILAIIIYY